MAGRGTDVRLEDGVAALGGLHVLATERHESHRIDRQLYGRAARLIDLVLDEPADLLEAVVPGQTDTRARRAKILREKYSAADRFRNWASPSPKFPLFC
jgi:hypothetical protein